jgi:Holliday junction resolvasome RuvABC endonuclease subunit
MTRILGVFIRIRDKRYVAGLACIDAGQVMGSRSLPAPAEPEATQLAELYSRVVAAIDEFGPEFISMRASETLTGERAAKHTEGVVCAAAGHRNLRVDTKFGRTLVSRAGLGQKGASKAAVQLLAGRLGGSAGLTPECLEAAAAAAAAAVEIGEL